MPKTQVCCCLQQYPRKTSDGGVISSHSDLIYCDTQGTGNWRDLQNMLSAWIQNVIPFTNKLKSQETKWNKFCPLMAHCFHDCFIQSYPRVTCPTVHLLAIQHFFFNIFVLHPLFFSCSLINKQLDHVELPSNIALEIFYPYTRWLEPSLTSGYILPLCRLTSNTCF